MAFHDDLKVLYTTEQVLERVASLGAQITRDYAGKDLAVVCVLKGSFVFAADLVRAIDLPLSLDFLGVSSYGARSESSGVVRITSDLSRPVEGRHLLVVLTINSQNR
jgi:hypoxanthine phosphoribosyltransferase